MDEWLVDYHVEDPEFNKFAQEHGDKLKKEHCVVCERQIAVPSTVDCMAYVCVSCSDDAIHDFIERR